MLALIYLIFYTNGASIGYRYFFLGFLLTKDEAKSSVLSRDGMGWTATFNWTLEETD